MQLAGIQVPQQAGSNVVDDILEVLKQSLWLAVPKRKTSYSRKRMRQLERTKAAKNLQEFYPCPNCDEGWLKLRHHLCVCAMKQLRVSVPKRRKVRYGDHVNVAADDEAEAALGPSSSKTKGSEQSQQAAKQAAAAKKAVDDKERA